MYTARSIAITETLRTLHVLKKGLEDIQVEWKARSEDMILVVNKSMRVSHVSLLPVSLSPQRPKLSVAGLAQALMQNSERKGLESHGLLHAHLPLIRPLRRHHYRA